MECLRCNGPLKTRHENYLYDGAGLPGVTLMDVAVSRCKSCGDDIVELLRPQALHQAIAARVIRKSGRLAREEVRFLRSILELSGVDLARVMGTSPVSISRWENGRAPIGIQADKLLRMLVAALPGQDVYSLEDLQGAASSKEAAPLRMKLRLKGTAWTAMAA